MKYRLQDLIDIEQFQVLQDRLNEIYSFPSAIIDNDGIILTSTAWQDICTKFHRQDKECEKECIKSDKYILSHLAEAKPAVSYVCPHGLVDNATPIIINGVHLGNFFTGQFFLEEPDLDFFRAQAKRYGFDEDAYLEAVRRVPVWTQDQLNSYLFFIKGLIEVIAVIGLKNLLAIEARQEAEERERQFQAMFNVAAIGIAQTDPRTGRWVRVNQKQCDITGYTSEELLELSVSDITHPDDLEKDLEAFQRVVRGEAPSYRREKRYIRKDGSVVWVNVNMTLVRDDAGQPIRTIATIEDITERRLSEKGLRESEERYRNLFERANDGIFILSDQGELVSVNESFARMHGYDTAEMLHMNLADLDTPETFQLVPERIRRILTGEALTFEVEHYHKDGHVFPLEVSAKLIPIGGESRIQCIHRDITERKRAEQEKAKLESQLHQAQKMESVGRLAGGVAHDFNNMLSVIIGNAELALSKLNPSDPIHDEIQEILEAGKRSADLTRQLLAFARKQAIVPKVLDLNDTIAGMLKMLSRLIGENIDLVWKPGKSLGPVIMDPAQLDQVLANLMVNARDAIAGVGTVTIETDNVEFDEDYCNSHAGFVSGKYIALVVSDDGCGIDKDTLKQIFEPFFTTKATGKGTGLGLATVYGIVKQNGGFINVYSELGTGTSFSIYLPRQEGECGESQDTETVRIHAGNGETVLLAEDEPAVMSLCKAMLGRLGYSVLPAGTPSEALHLAEAHPGEIHLLITDVIMPGMNGRELSAQIAAKRPGIKHLFMSGYTADAIAHHGILDEDVEFISKPFTLKNLASKVYAALRHA